MDFDRLSLVIPEPPEISFDLGAIRELSVVI